MASKTASNSSSENGNGNLQIKWDLIREISEAFESLRNRKDETLKSLLLGKKVEVEEHINFITEQRSHSGEDKDFPFDASSLIEDLNTLLSLFRTSEYDSKALAEMGELFKSLEARRPLLSPLINDDDKESNSINVGEADGQTELDCNLDDEERETDYSTAATSKGASCSQGKGKNKKNNKPKKRKGGKRK